MENLDSLFTLQSLVSLQGSTAAAFLVPNVLRSLLGAVLDPYKKWIAFLVAMVLSYLVAYLAPNIDFTKWILAFFNGCLVFASAVGVNEAAVAGAAPATGANLGGKRFFKSWF